MEKGSETFTLIAFASQTFDPQADPSPALPVDEARTYGGFGMTKEWNGTPCWFVGIQTRAGVRDDKEE